MEWNGELWQCMSKKHYRKAGLGDFLALEMSVNHKIGLCLEELQFLVVVSLEGWIGLYKHEFESC